MSQLKARSPREWNPNRWEKRTLMESIIHLLIYGAVALTQWYPHQLFHPRNFRNWVLNWQSSVLDPLCSVRARISNWKISNIRNQYLVRQAYKTLLSKLKTAAISQLRIFLKVCKTEK